MKIEWKTCFKVGFSIFVLYLCIHHWQAAADLTVLLLGAALPLLIGCVIAYLVNILMSFYERHYFAKSNNSLLIKSKRPICMLGAFITLITVFFLIVRLVAPQLASCVQVILSEVPVLIEKGAALFREWGVLPENFTDSLTNVDWRSRIEQIARVLTSGIGSMVGIFVTTLSSVFSWIVTGLLAVIFAIYLLAGKEKLGGQFHKVARHYLKDSWCKKLDYVFGVVNDCFHRYIVGQCTEAVILGLLCTVGMLVLRLPYATMIGALIGFTALIPVAGAYIGAGVGAFMIMTVSPVKAVIFLIFIVILQQLEGNIIYPKVVGSSMGLPGIWVLAAVTIGGGVMGIPGMLISVPLVAVIYRLLRDDVNKQP